MISAFRAKLTLFYYAVTRRAFSHTVGQTRSHFFSAFCAEFGSYKERRTALNAFDFGRELRLKFKRVIEKKPVDSHTKKITYSCANRKISVVVIA